MTLIACGSCTSSSIPPFAEFVEFHEDSLKDKEVLLFLDYDGTLTPIVPDPDQAILGEDMSNLLLRLAPVYSLSVVTGRGMECISNFLGSEIRKQVAVAASHGFDIKLRNGTRMQVADHRHAVIFEDFKKALRSSLQTFPLGCAIEETGYSVTLHYRHAAESDVPVIEKMFDDLIMRYPELEKRGGKKVFEARLGFDWNKGKAIEWMICNTGKDPDKCLIVYIGDDLTDEDAFQVLKGYPYHLSIIVCGEDELPRVTSAEYRMMDQNDVYKFLSKLIEYKRLPPLTNSVPNSH